jgi:hypothetical protein
MKKLILAVALTFALATGSMAILTIQPTPAMACDGSGCN